MIQRRSVNVSVTNNGNVGAVSPDDEDLKGKVFFTSTGGNTAITLNMLPVLVATIGFLMSKLMIDCKMSTFHIMMTIIIMLQCCPGLPAW